MINNKHRERRAWQKILMSCENRVYVKKNYNFKFNFS